MENERSAEAGKYDARNQLNDLTGKEWLKLTKSFWFSEKCADDKAAFAHPAPFLIKDIERLISMFTKRGMRVLDPFMGSGTTGLAAHNLERYSIGVDLNPEYRTIALRRYVEKGMRDDEYEYMLGDSTQVVGDIAAVDYVVTSPPYHNILKNDAAGLRADKSKKGYRNGSRQGIDYYSDMPNDLGNQESYAEFLQLLSAIMAQCYRVLQLNKYCSIIISDFTVDKKEVCVQSDIVRLMQDIGFEFVGTIALLQDNKPLYPFGYPYAFKINHMHQNIINFRKRAQP